jgi:cytochrome c-type biogenesis protein CcmH
MAMLMVVAGSATTPSWPAGQVDIYEFPSAAAELRYRTLIDEFRCPKCLNTNLSGSDAPIAKDLRRTVHRLIVEEDYSDQEIRDFLQARYGDFVLYNPPFKPGTWLLWLAPVVFLVLGLWVLFRVLRPSAPVSLSAEDQARLRDILKDS